MNVEIHTVSPNVVIPDAHHLVTNVDDEPEYIGQGHNPKVVSCLKERNVVIMPSVGKRSLATMLATSNIDSDESLVIKDPTLLPTNQADPSEYEGVKPQLLERDSTVEDISDFLAEHMQSDDVGLVADVYLIIADQSKHGTYDRDCIALTKLCSQTVDYPKNGVRVSLD